MLWYKESFISFVEESKYIWLQHRQPDSSSLCFLFRYKDGRTGLSPQPLFFSEARQALTLTAYSVFNWLQEKKKRFSEAEAALDRPHPKVKNQSFPSWLDNKGGISGSAFWIQEVHFQHIVI